MTREGAQRALAALVVGLAAVVMMTSATACTKSEETKPVEEVEVDVKTEAAPAEPAPAPDQKPET